MPLDRAEERFNVFAHGALAALYLLMAVYHVINVTQRRPY